MACLVPIVDNEQLTTLHFHSLEFRVLHLTYESAKNHMHSTELNRFDKYSKIFLVGVFFFFPIWLAATNTVLALMLLFWLLSGHFKMRWHSVRNNPITLPALILYGLVIIGSAYSPAKPSEILQHLNKYSIFIFILIAISLLQDIKWRRYCWNAFNFSMIFTLFCVYANIWVDLPWSITHNKGWGVDHTVFKDYIAQSIMMSLFILQCIHKSRQANGVRIKFLWMTLGLLAIISVTHLSSGRTGYLALLVSLLAYAIFSIHSQKKWLVIGLSGFIFTILLMNSNTASQRIDSMRAEVHNYIANSNSESIEAKMSSSGARLAMWKLSIDELTKRPLIGAGTASYRYLAKNEFKDTNLCNIACVHPHNQFLFFGVEYGLLGITFYLFLFYRSMKFAGTLDRFYKPLFFGFLGIFFVDSMVHGALWLAVERHYFSFVLALFMATSSKSYTGVKTEMHHP